MEKIYHFISGLPRSGSTLLSSILLQNPRFTAGISDLLIGHVESVSKVSNGAHGARTLIDDEKKVEMMRALFDAYYSNDREVCFNTNRLWQSKTPLLKILYPNFKMIVCVRSFSSIVNSFEKIDQKSPLTPKTIYNGQILPHAAARYNVIMGQNGMVSENLKGLESAIYSEHTDHMIFVEYNALAKQPEQTMRKIYEFLGEDYYDHDYDNVENSYDEYDQDLGMSGLHTVKRKVEYVNEIPIIPKSLFIEAYRHDFWQHQDFDKNRYNWISDPED